MAELGSEATNLFQELFYPKQAPRDETADVRDVNNIDPHVKNHHLQSGNDSASHSIDNGIVTHTRDSNGYSEDCPTNHSHDNVMLNNIENLKKSKNESSNSKSKTDAISNDNKANSTKNDNHACSINGDTSTSVAPKDAQGGKQKRGIHFPKETIISGYFEPPDPWKNAPTWTTEELITAYKKSCEIHGAKPIAKLLQQLQAISPHGKREELLSLKGEKLDQKQCECIEEILRRVQFKVVDLETSHLDDECAVALFDMIEYYESACQLNISFNKNIQARGWQACSRLVRRTPSLTYLDMRSCDLNDRTIPIFGRALKLGCHLTILHMENMSLSGRPLVILVAALKMNETLQELFLAENKLTPTDGVQLGNLLRNNHKLALLDLRNNHLQDVGTSHICDGLMEQKSGRGLRTLVLWNNTVNYQAMPALGRALAISDSLETLNIGHNFITNEGVHLLKDGLLKTNSLLRLGLQGTKISDEGAVALAEYIADSVILLRIDLRENDIKTGGLMALSHAMRVNTSVTRIDLDKDPKKESGMKDYAEQQSRLLRDILTFQQRNIQSAQEREDRERAKLEEKAEAAAAARQKEVGHKKETETSAEAGTSNENFTVIGEEEALDKDEGQEKDEVGEEEEIKDAEEEEEEIKDADEEEEEIKDADEEEENKSENSEEEEDTEEAAEVKEVIKHQHRPCNLYPYIGLRPQESLDSPLPTSNDHPAIYVAHSRPVSCPSPEKDRMSLTVGSAPAEMILSPQYFPKQMARKIFSVSRVDESCVRLSTSAPPDPISTAFDPLCVSSVPLVSSSSSSTTPFSAPSSLVPQSTSGVLQHSASSQPTSVSPISSLFQDLADETVKHMVSPDVDIDVKSLLAHTAVTESSHRDMESLQGNPDSCSKDNTETVKGGDIANFGALSSSTESSDLSTKEAEVSEHAKQGDTPSTLVSDTGNCDSSHEFVSSLSTEESTSKISAGDKNDEGSRENSGESQVVVSSCEGKEDENSLQETEPAPDLESSHHTSQPDASVTSDVTLGYNIDQPHCEKTEDHHPSPADNGEEKHVSLSEPEKPFSPEKAKQNMEAVDSNQCSDPSSESVIGDDIGNGGNSQPGPAEISQEGAGDVPIQKENYEEKDSSSQPSQDFPADLPVDSTTSQGTTNQTWPLSSEPAELNTEDELVSVCLNNSSSPSLLLPEESGDFSSFSPFDENTDVKNSKGDAEKGLTSSPSEEDFLGLTMDEAAAPPGQSKQPEAKGASSKASNILVTSDSAEDLFGVYSSSSDSLDIENVDLSLDEEPWLAVGGDSDTSDTDKSKEPPKQPDFFTTLSMNGLTQELASALTSLDGSTTCFGDDEEEDIELQPPDEFERELDAMLAVVQSELPWPLKDS